LEVTYLEPWYTHPGFCTAIAQVVRQAHQQLALAATSRVATIYTAHSIPEPMAAQAPYVQQFAATAAASAALCAGQEYRLAYQSQATGTPFAWLQPDINDAIQQAAAEGYQAVVVTPIGFLCDHVEVLYDLDVQARQTAQECGVQFARAATVGTHPTFLDMLSTLLVQRLRG
jgi:ferrochelatase